MLSNKGSQPDYLLGYITALPDMYEDAVFPGQPWRLGWLLEPAREVNETIWEPPIIGGSF